MHRGRDLARIGSGYLRWLVDRIALEPRWRWLHFAVCTELERRTPPEAPVTPANDLPRAEPCVVQGVALDEIEAGHFARAVSTGELTIWPCLPLASPVPLAWKRWCAATGHPHRVRTIPSTNNTE
jgi:hypothetical protein